MRGERLTADQREVLSLFRDGQWRDVLSETFLGDQPHATFFRASSLAVLGLIEIDNDADEPEETVYARLTDLGRRALEEADHG